MAPHRGCAPGKGWIFETHGEALFHAICQQDHEGIVAKQMDAPYRAGPCNAWLKIKNREYSRRGAVEWQG